MRAALGAVLAVISVAAPALAADPCQGGLCDATALAPVFRSLDDATAGRRGRPVHILEIGDSHTANDLITGALRDQLQFRFGRGGRGVLAPGEPLHGAEPRLVQVSQTGEWRTELSFAPPPNPAHPKQQRLYAGPPPFGLSGYRLVGSAGATLILDAEADAGFSRTAVCALAGPAQGSLTLAAGEVRQRFSLVAPTVQPVCHAIHTAAPQHQVKLTIDGGPVSLLSWATFGESGGVVLSNLGVSGTQLRDFAARDDAVLAAEFDAYKPDFIILAYGANEGYAETVDAAAYEALLRDQLQRLKRLTHGTPVLVLGAPDEETLRPDLYGTGGTFPRCEPLSDDEQRNFTSLVAQRSPLLARWFPPAGLEPIRAAQRRAALTEGAAYWDWAARMGGPCSAHQMSLADPRLVRGDHIHYTVEGGARIAGLLFTDLMRADFDDGGKR